MFWVQKILGMLPMSGLLEYSFFKKFVPLLRSWDNLNFPLSQPACFWFPECSKMLQCSSECFRVLRKHVNWLRRKAGNSNGPGFEQRDKFLIKTVLFLVSLWSEKNPETRRRVHSYQLLLFFAHSFSVGGKDVS